MRQITIVCIIGTRKSFYQANSVQITFAYVFIYAWSVCIIKFSILALYRRIFGLSWLGWFCIALTSGYLITNHVVLPLYTRPLSYYWNQWYGAEGEILVDEAKVRSFNSPTISITQVHAVLPRGRHHQSLRRRMHSHGTHIERA